MKTPEQWFNETQGHNPDDCQPFTIEEINRIAADAMSEQRRLDAAICDSFKHLDAATCNAIKAEILKYNL